MSRASESDAPRTDVERVAVWDLPVRVVHWTLVALLVGLVTTGLIGNEWLEWHMRLGKALIAVVLFRVLWGFAGSRNARFRTFVRGPRAAASYVRSRFERRPEIHVTHNPLGGWMVMALIGLVGLQALSGLFAADEDRLVIEGPFVKFVASATVDFAAKWHHRIFDAIQIFAVLHIAANLFYTFVKKDPLIQGMARGWKPAADYVDQKSAQPGSWAAAAVCLAVAAAIVFGGIIAAGGKL